MLSQRLAGRLCTPGAKASVCHADLLLPAPLGGTLAPALLPLLVRDRGYDLLVAQGCSAADG